MQNNTPNYFKFEINQGKRKPQYISLLKYNEVLKRSNLFQSITWIVHVVCFWFR